MVHKHPAIRMDFCKKRGGTPREASLVPSITEGCNVSPCLPPAQYLPLAVRPSPETRCSAMVFNLPTSRTMRNKYLYFINHSLKYPIIAAQNGLKQPKISRQFVFLININCFLLPQLLLKTKPQRWYKGTIIQTHFKDESP